MSDWEEDMYDDEEEEELSFEEDENENENENDNNIQTNQPNISLNIESLYFKAKYLKEEDNLNDSIELFNKIISTDDISFEYLFKSRKQLIKIYEKEKQIDQIINLLNQLFEMKNIITIDKSYFNSSLYKIIQRIEHKNYDSSFTKPIYQIFYQYLLSIPSNEIDSSSNQKLKFKIELLISNNHLKDGNLDSALKILENLESEIEHSNETIKNSYYLDIIASKILILMNDNKNLKELKRLSAIANSLISGIPKTRILGIINEGSGLVSMYSNDYINANKYFQNSFKNFNDSGDDRRHEVLIKYIFSSILSKSEVNPFQSSDFQGFLKLDSIKILMQIYNLFQNMNVIELNKIIKSQNFIQLSEKYIFIQDFIPELCDLIYVNYITKYIRLFHKVRFEYFTTKLDISIFEFKKIIIKLFNKGLIFNCKIDFIDNFIINENFPKFIDINFINFIENAFIYYDFSYSTIFEFFENQVQNMKKRQRLDSLSSNNTSFSNYEENEFGLNNSIAENFDNDINLDFNNNNGNLKNKNIIGSIKNKSIFTSDKNILRNLNEFNFSSLNKSLTSQNLEDAIFETCFGSFNLKSLTSSLYKDKIIKKDLSKTTQPRSNLLGYINQYIDLMESSLPLLIIEDVSYVNKIKDTQITNEFNKLFKSNLNGSLNTSFFYKNDDNIPDVIQSSIMNELEPPSDPDMKNDPDAFLKGNEKKIHRLKLIDNSISIIEKKHHEFLVKLVNYIVKTNNSTSSISIPNAKTKKVPFDFNRSFLNRVINNRDTVSRDQSETTSLDNMSFDGDFEREYEF
jgi:hypothetical protein